MPIWSPLTRLFSSKAVRRDSRRAAGRSAGSSSSTAVPSYGGSGLGFGSGYSFFYLGGGVPDLTDSADDSCFGGAPYLGNVVVAAAVSWLARNFGVPDLRVVEDGGDGDDAEIEDHWLIAKFDRPNAISDFFGFFALSVISDIVDGNTFWLKRKDRAGGVLDFWWLPPWQVTIIGGGPDGGPSKYEYRTGGRVERYDAADVVHVKNLPNPDDPYRGMTPLDAPGVRRSMRVVDAVGRYDDKLMTNSGIVPYAIAPADPEHPIPSENAAALRDSFRQKYSSRGTNAGDPFVSTQGLTLTRLGFSPEEMAVESIPTRHIANVAAALGMAPMSLGFPDVGRTYSNLQEANRWTYTNGLMSIQARFAEAINRDPDLIVEGERAEWDYANVSALQEDRAVKIGYLAVAVEKQILLPDEARAELGYPPMADVQPEPESTPPATPPTALPDALGGQDGANGDGTLPDALAARLRSLEAIGTANGNGVAKTAVHPATHDDLAVRAARVLGMLEAKLAGETGVEAEADDSDADDPEVVEPEPDDIEVIEPDKPIIEPVSEPEPEPDPDPATLAPDA